MQPKHNQSIPQRIMIFGRPGSGKSTCAFELHQSLNLPLYHLDCYFYTKNWVERDYQEFLTIQQEIVDQEQWIIDGNCTSSLEMRHKRANLVLYFNYPRYLCYVRIFKRLFHKNKKIQDRAPGCAETIRWSLLSYIWTFEKRVADKIKKLKSMYPNVQFVEIKNNNDLEKLKKELLNTY